MDTKADTNADVKIGADAEAIGFQAWALKSRCAARAQAKGMLALHCALALVLTLSHSIALSLAAHTGCSHWLL